MTMHSLKLFSSLGPLKTSEERKKLMLSLDSMPHKIPLNNLELVTL